MVLSYKPPRNPGNIMKKYLRVIFKKKWANQNIIKNFHTNIESSDNEWQMGGCFPFGRAKIACYNLFYRFSLWPIQFRVEVWLEQKLLMVISSVDFYFDQIDFERILKIVIQTLWDPWVVEGGGRKFGWIKSFSGFIPLLTSLAPASPSGSTGKLQYITPKPYNVSNFVPLLW